MGHALTAPRPRTRGTSLLAAAGAACLLASLAPAGTPVVPGGLPAVTVTERGNSWRTVLDPGLPVSGSDLQRVVVSGVSGSLELLRQAVSAVGGTVTKPLPLVDGVSATIPAELLPQLAGRPEVRAITADRSAKVSTIEWDESTTASTYATTAGATASWALGARGSSIGVAVLDTGVSAHPDLGARVVSGPDLSGENDNQRDSYGHGTVMAGAVAGSGVDSAPSYRTGIAPRAHIVSVKVAGATGVTDVSTVLAAMDWISSFKETYGIRVMNLSWGVPSTQDPAIDPLSLGVQRLWQQGVVVVVAAGNSGPYPTTITKPGDDPVVLTVGAYDDRGDLLDSNDVVPKWSSQGPTAQGVAKPDLVAPGRTLVLARAAGSTVELEHPKAHVAPSYIKGSGTSQAAAVTSGAVALMLSARPWLTPDQVKSLLKQTAVPISNESTMAQGAGRIRTAVALVSEPSTETQALTATGTGTLDGSRGTSSRVQVECDGVIEVLDDETTSWCEAWNGASWKDSTWTGASWKSDGWTGASWKTDAWSGASWKNATWTGASWKGDSWTGASWKVSGWSGASWKEGSWTSAEYDEEDEFLTGFWGNGTQPGRPLPGELTEAEATFAQGDASSRETFTPGGTPPLPPAASASSAVVLDMPTPAGPSPVAAAAAVPVSADCTAPHKRACP
jgi:serine protease AprX